MSRWRHGAHSFQFSRTRRSVLIGAGAVCVRAAFAAAPPTLKAAIPARRGPVDVHHHWYSRELRGWWGSNSSDVGWSADRALSAMDEAGVSTSMLSITQPGVWKSADADGSIKLARSCNEAMARTTHDHSGRFGFFAAVALPAVAASIAEIGYSLDALKADGVGLLSSYDGKYLGDPDFTPVFEELNHRRAVVYVHPTVPACCAQLVPGVPGTAFEAPSDTTRTIESLLYGGVLARFSSISFIFAHGGGSLPFLAERLLGSIGPDTQADKDYLSPLNARAALARLYFDCASVVNPPAWAALTTFTTAERILFGSDYPAREIRAGLGGLHAMEQRFGTAQGDAQNIEYRNAQRLFAARLG